MLWNEALTSWRYVVEGQLISAPSHLLLLHLHLHDTLHAPLDFHLSVMLTSLANTRKHCSKAAQDVLVRLCVPMSNVYVNVEAHWESKSQALLDHKPPTSNQNKYRIHVNPPIVITGGCGIYGLRWHDTFHRGADWHWQGLPQGRLCCLLEW